MVTSILLIIYGLFLILGGFMGLKKGSKISLYMGAGSGILVFAGVWILTFDPKFGWILLSCLNALLAASFTSRLLKTRKFMPSGVLLLVSLAVLVFCLVQLR